MLPESMRTALREHLGLLRRDVILHLPTGSVPDPLVTEILAASPRVSVRELVSIEAPKGLPGTFAVSDSLTEIPRVFFAGSPTGHEFTSLVLALLHAGGHPPKVDASLLTELAAVQVPLLFETFYSPSCHNCPDVVQALNLVATVNPNISHVAINTAVHPDVVAARSVLSVPSVYVNGVLFATGKMSFAELAGKILAHVGVPKAPQQPRDLGRFDVAVIGGGPAGIAAAVYASRKGLRTTLLAERLGGQVLDTVRIENIIGIPRTEGPKYARDLEEHLRANPVEVHHPARVKHLTTAPRPGLDHGLELDSGSHLTARSVIVATGASWRRMNVPGESEYLTRGVTFCPHCDGPIFTGKKVAVIGGGNSGVEAALDLSNIVDEVYLLEFSPSLRADAVLQAALSLRPNVTVLLAAETTEVLGDGEKVTGLLYKDRTAETIHRLDLAGIFVQIGLIPATSWLPECLPTSASGEILVDARGGTALPGIFAAGDASSVPYKQIVTALSSGAAAAIAAFEYLMTPVDPFGTDDIISDPTGSDPIATNDLSAGQESATLTPTV